ncbi:MAG: patatin-like phospholipase family protein [Rubrivivax sp.]|nr:patatin-like phospholipase family protein [Rubrivivax sp.]
MRALALILWLACGLGAGSPARAAETSPARPKVGLVLGGGGARGAAHIGVLEVLERLRVPVDCVAGTSMGALVAGAWAAGLSPADMRRELAQADWADLFLDNPGYDDLNFRNKRQSQRFLPGSETGLKDGSTLSPSGVVAGQKIKLFFNQLVHADTGEPELHKLPLPVSIIATDIGSGERVVLRDGSLTQAMRASMSVPGLMAPLEYRGRKLVDGGLVDNVPIREVRERCGAQVVIAVNVGSPALAPEAVNGLLSVAAQVIVLLTEQNVSRSLATLAVDEPQYAAWRRQVAVHERGVPRVDYRIDATPRGRHILRITPVEKSWGPDYLRLGLRLDGSLSQGSSFLVRGGYQKTWLNELGGELLASAELGSSTGARLEFYQPVTRSQALFLEAATEYRRERTDYFVVEQRVAQYRSARSRLDLTAGVNFRQLGQLRAGWRETKVTHALDTGVDVPALAGERSSGGWLLALDMDRLDKLYFPRRGWAAQLSWYDSERSGYSRLGLEARGAIPWRDFVLGGRATWVGSPRGQLPFNDAGKLGGFLNLTGFANGQLLGDEVAYAHVRAERIIGRAPAGLRGDMRLGVALEAGKVGQPYALQRREGWLGSVALYLGGETPVGPVYIGVGQASGGSTNAYLFIGTP